MPSKQFAILTIALIFLVVVPNPPLCAQGALFTVSSYKSIHWTRVGKFTQDTIQFRNLDSVSRLHVKISFVHDLEFSVVGNDSLDIGPLEQGVATFRFSPLSAGGRGGDIRYVTDGTTSRTHKDSAGFDYISATAIPATDTLPWFAAYMPYEISSSLDTFATVTLEIVNQSDTTRNLIGNVSIQGLHSNLKLLGVNSFSVQPYDTAFFVFQYRPTSLGKYSDTIAIESNSDHPLYKFVLTETALSALTSSLSTTAINFGNVDVGRDSSADVFYSNTSGRPSFLLGKYLAPKPPFYLLQDSLGIDSLTPNDTRTLSIDFRPAAPGKFDDSLVITSNATPSERRLVVYLHGEATVSSVQSLPLESAEIISNPAHDHIYVRVSTQEPDQITLELLNELGQVVISLEKLPLDLGPNRLSIPVSDLPRGEYFLQLFGRHPHSFKIALQ